MDFDWAPEEAEFRHDLKTFLEAELPANFDAFAMEPEEQKAFSKAFAVKLAEKRWLTPPGPANTAVWPRGRGNS